MRYITNPTTGEKDKYVEDSLVTLGDDVNQCSSLIKKKEDGTLGYSASDVVDYLLSGWEESQKQVRKGAEELVEPIRWGYSSTEVADYLLSEWNNYLEQTHEDSALVLV